MCSKYDFSKITDVQFFLRPLWYGSPYTEQFMTDTGLTQTQFDNLYYMIDPDSLGGYYYHVQAEVIYEHFMCEGLYSNCTAAELAGK